MGKNLLSVIRSWVVKARRMIYLRMGGAAAEKVRTEDQRREELRAKNQRFHQRLKDLFEERDRARQEAFFLNLEKHRGKDLEGWREAFFRELKVYEVKLFEESEKGIHLDLHQELHQELPSDWL